VGEKTYGARSGGFNDRNKERTHDGARPARSFGDRPAFGDKPAFSNSERPARNADRFANENRAAPSREVDGNSRSYTKDTDMQFARELSKGFGGKSGDRTGAPRSTENRPFARKPEGSFGDRPNRNEGSRSAPRGDAPRSAAPRNNTGEKFGNPRPRPTGDRPARTNGGDSAPRRPRSFV